MTMNAQSVLKSLAEVSRNGQKGFATAAAAVKDEKLRGVLERASERCALGAKELEEAIGLLGGDPASVETTPGPIHRAWTNLKATIAGADNKAVLEECERGEDVAKAAYQNALEEDLPIYARDVIDRQYRGVLENHDLIKRLREAA